MVLKARDNDDDDNDNDDKDGNNDKNDDDEKTLWFSGQGTWSGCNKDNPAKRDDTRRKVALEKTSTSLQCNALAKSFFFLKNHDFSTENILAESYFSQDSQLPLPCS